ncbi:MAG TPA: HAMP domain-containing sensor histidine kinase, partial [Polyangiaceae bacterium]|nr:HAMP domain-containing sensor histidine kinase [Polyangiaceae bacterium]
IDCARRAGQLIELERAVLASLAQQHEGERAPHDLALNDLVLRVESIAAPGTLAAVLVVDERAPGTLQLRAAASLPSGYTAQLAGSLIEIDVGSRGPLSGLDAAPLVADIASDALPERPRRAALGAGLRACWSLPVVAGDGALLGAVAFYHREWRAPAADDRVLLEGAARLTRLVLEHERALGAALRSARRERVLLAAARVLATEDDVPRAMQTLLAELGGGLSRSAGSWPAGIVWLSDGAGAPLQRVAVWSSDPGRFDRFLAIARCPSLPHGTLLAPLSGAARPPALLQPSPLQPSLLASAAACDAGIRNGLAIPIVAGDVSGSIELFATLDESFEPELESALRSVGLQAAEFCRRARAQADRQRLIAELRETVRFSELFASILAHDLRNPLNTLSMGTQLLAKSATPGDGAVLQRMQNSATRMSRMIEQLLDLTRSREGCGLALDRDALHLGELASAVVHELAIAYPERRIELRVAGDTCGQWDRDRLGQVLSNLVGNAIEHGEGGPVRVLVEAHDEGRVYLETHNLGRIDPDALTTLFDPFKPARPTAKRSRGLGLGLYISHLIVTAHGGSIDVCSDAEGTRFRVLLPRAIDASTPLPAPITLPPPSEVRGPGTRAPSASNDV